MEGSGERKVDDPHFATRRRLSQGALRFRRAAKRPFQALGRVLLRAPLASLLLLGLAVRLLLAPFTSWTHDVYAFYRVAVDMIGGLNPYETSIFTYPPLFAYLLFPLHLLAGLLANPAGFADLVPAITLAAETTEMITPTVTAPLFNLVMKLPAIAADLGIALLLLTWVSQVFGERRGRTAFLLWFLNPFVIWVTVLQGQFDAIPAFFALAATFLLVRRRYLFSGLALGLAILFKVYPLFLVLPLVFLAAAWGRRHAAEQTPARAPSLQAALLFLLGNAIVVAAFALPLLSTPFLEVTFVRRAQFPIFGGFTPLFILHLDVWEQLPFGRALLEALPEVPYLLLISIPITLSVLGGILVLRRPGMTVGEGRGEAAIAFLTVVPLVALFSAVSLVNPHHLLWILPFLILASAVWRRLYLTIAVVSAGGLAFLLGLQGVAVFFYPLAVHTPLLGVEDIQAQVLAYWNLPGLVSTRLQRDLLALATGAGYMFLLYAAYRVTRDFLASPVSIPTQAAAPANPGPSPHTARRLKWTVATVAVVLVVSGAFVLLPSVPSAALIERVEPDSALGTVTVELRGHSLFHSSYRVTSLSLGTAWEDHTIYLYYDDTYPFSNTSGPRIFGLIDHLRSELTNAGVSKAIRLVDAVNLPSLLRGPSAILLMTTTAWPANVLPAQPTLVREWLEAGGILVWTGGLLGAYMGTADGRILDLRERDPAGPWGPSVILGFDPVREGGPNRTTESTAWGTALATRYPLATWGARASEVQARGGLVVGGLTGGTDPKTSLSLLPVGNGTVALFGDAIGPVFTYSAEDVVAHDIARLLLSGLLFNPSVSQATLLGSRGMELGPGERGRIVLPTEMLGTTREVRLMAFSEVDHDPLLRAFPVPP